VKTKLIICLVSALPSLGFAQFGEFRITNAQIAFGTIQANGVASQHTLTVSITNTNGFIRGKGTRYNVAANAVSPSPLAGTNVTVASNAATNSRLGLPIIRTTNTYKWTNIVQIPPNWTNRTVVFTNTYIDSSCAAAIWLSDGARLKGFLTTSVNTEQSWDYERGRYLTNRYTNFYGELQATYNNGFGAGVDWQSPWSGSSGGMPIPISN